jgi:hypothetical protein
LHLKLPCQEDRRHRWDYYSQHDRQVKYRKDLPEATGPPAWSSMPAKRARIRGIQRLLYLNRQESGDVGDRFGVIEDQQAKQHRDDGRQKQERSAAAFDAEAEDRPFTEPFRATG